MSRLGWMEFVDVATGTRIKITEEGGLYDAFLDWVKAERLPIETIPLYTTIYRDEARCRVMFEQFLTDVEGRVRIIDDDVVHVCRVEQNEAPPQPFPETWRLAVKPHPFPTGAP